VGIFNNECIIDFAGIMDRYAFLFKREFPYFLDISTSFCPFFTRFGRAENGVKSSFFDFIIT
jgi:hypothetical protein